MVYYLACLPILGQNEDEILHSNQFLDQWSVTETLWPSAECPRQCPGGTEAQRHCGILPRLAVCLGWCL